MFTRVAKLALAATLVTSALAVPLFLVRANVPDAVRGKYLVTLGLCTDCHTPGYFFGKPDKTRFLGGSEVGFEIPELGVFHGPNLTPDAETGLGRWSTQQIVTALRTGTRPDGRVLAPIMPWQHFANLTDADANAIAAYLRTLPPVKNKVPGPFGASETPTSFVFKVVPPPAS
jgi:mono/diheme cytochrome c family protein